MNNNLRLIRNVIYRLKREYGGKVVVYRRTATVTDIKKGTEVNYYRQYPVNRAIVLPAIASREEHPNVQGIWRSYFDQSKTNIIIDGHVIAIIPEEGDLVQIDSEQFEIAEVNNAGDGRSYLIQLQSVEVFTRIQNHDIYLSSMTHCTVGVTND